MTPGWLLGVIFFSAAIATSYFLSQSGIAKVTTCPTLLFFDLACPFCGGTRSTFALLRGDPFAAFRWNPLIAVSLVFFPLWISIWMFLGIRIRINLSPPRFLAGFLLLLMLNWAYVLGTQKTSALSNPPDHRGSVEFNGAER